MFFETERFETYLVECVTSKIVHRFRYILEELKFNPNKRQKCFDGLSTFEKVLTIPDSKELIEICVSNGCDFYKRNSDGKYPLHYAIQSNSADNLNAILKRVSAICVNPADCKECEFCKKNPDGKYPLHYAIQSNSANERKAISKRATIKRVDPLVCKGRQFDQFQYENPGKNYPLHYTIATYCPDSSKALSNQETLICEDPIIAVQYSAIINEKFEEGNNYLHLLSASITEDNYGEISKMIVAMLENGCNVNSPNEKHETPFYLLLKNPLVDNMLLNSIIDNVRIDYYTHNSEDIKERMEKLGLADRIGKKDDVTVDKNYMIQHLGDWDDTQFTIYFELWNKEKMTLGDSTQVSLEIESSSNEDGIMELLEVAIVRNLAETVAILMQRGPKINRFSKNSKFKLPPAFLACTFGHYNILKLLLKHKDLSFASENPRRNLLHQIFSAKTIDPDDRQRTFNLIIDDERCTLDVINGLDSESRVPLALACQYECNDIVKELLRRGAYIGYKNVLEYMKKDTLEEFLDESVKCSGDISERDCEVYIDYKFLMPPDRSEPENTSDSNSDLPDLLLNSRPFVETNAEIFPAHLISEDPNLKELLLHPVIASFVLLKWRKIDFIVYFNLLVYFFYLLFLGYTIVNFYNTTTDFESDGEYCGITKEYHDIKFGEIVKFDAYNFNSSTNKSLAQLLYENLEIIQKMNDSAGGINLTKNFEKFNHSQKYQLWRGRFRQYFGDHHFWAFSFLTCGLLVLACTEVLQCAMTGKKYFFSSTNWLDIALIGFSYFALSDDLVVGKTYSYNKDVFFEKERFKQIGAVMILLIGAQSIKLLAKVSMFSLSLHMAVLTKVCGTFMKTIGPYLVIIVAFGMSFFALNHEAHNEAKMSNKSTSAPGFSNPFLSTVSTVKMMLSDFSAVTIERDGYFQGTLFLAFVISISIILLNLLNALAISDTNRVLEDAEFVETKKRISTIRGIETFFLFFKVTYANIFPLFTTITLKPNISCTIIVKERKQKEAEKKARKEADKEKKKQQNARTSRTTRAIIFIIERYEIISNVLNKYADKMFWIIWKWRPWTFDRKLINKILNYVTTQPDSQDIDRVLEEIIAIKDIICNELSQTKISRQYESSTTVVKDDTRF